MKILTIIGARPQFIKAGSFSREVLKYNDLTEVILHTGQHYDSNMSDVFFEEMKIPKPDYYLGIGGKSHGAMTGQMIEKIEEVALIEDPDWVVVYGDTNSTLAGAIVASKLHIKLAHIEAGLRSFNMKMPEEVNRILTDRVSNILFCPTDTAITNLKNEGFNKFNSKVVKSGDIMLDGAMFYRKYAKKPTVQFKKEFTLCTIHRAENTDDETRLKNIFTALNEIADDNQLILPLHPRTKQKIEEFDIDIEKLTIIEPVGYLEMIWMLDNCALVLTDSGGLQKEAFFFSKPCLILRNETEWKELVDFGFNVLVGADGNKIIENYKSLISNNYKFPNEDFQVRKGNLFGSGNASEMIIKELLQ